MNEKFRAFCFDGTHRMPPVTLYGADEVMRYIVSKKGYFPEIVVEAVHGFEVCKVENHEIVFPKIEG